MRLPFLVVLLMLLIVPALAQSYEITAEPLGGQLIMLGSHSELTYDVSTQGMAIQRFSADLPSGSQVNFTLTYGDGSTVDGWMQYTNAGFYAQYTDVGIGSMSSGYSYIGVQEIGRLDIIGYARNKTDNSPGFIVYDSVFGFSDQKAVAFYPTGKSAQAIYKIHITSNKPVTMTAYINTRANVEKAAATSLLDVVNEWITFVTQFANTAKNFVLELFKWVKFFFIDHVELVVALILVIPMAFAAQQSKGRPDRFLKAYFKTLRGFFEFFILMWHTFLDIIGIVRGWFRI